MFVRRGVVCNGGRQGGRRFPRAYPTRAGPLYPRRMLPRMTLAATGLLLALPTGAQAGKLTFGSDLSADATIAHAHQADTAFWPTAVGSGLPTAPEGGQILEIRIKGIAPRSPKPNHPSQDPSAGSSQVRFQTLETAGSSVQAKVTSGPFDIPTSGDPNQVSVFKPENMCVSKGNFVALNTIGGWDGVANRDPANGPTGPYPDGTPLQIFGSVPAATTQWFEADGKWADQSTSGTPFTPRPGRADKGGTLAGEELLVQLVLGTGADSVFHCDGGTFNPYKGPEAPIAPKPGGGGAPPGVQKTTIPTQRVNVSRKGVAAMAVFCQPGAGQCSGKVTITAKKGRRTIVVASQAFRNLKQKSTGKLKLKLTKAGLKLWKAKGRKLPVTITAVTGPGGSAYTSTFKVTMRKPGS